MVHNFKSIIAAIATRGESRLFIFDKEIFIFANEAKDLWQIAMKVSSKKVSEIREFVSYSFTSIGSLAIRDYSGKGVYFLYNIPAANRYVYFQKVLKDYLEEADCWSKLLS